MIEIRKAICKITIYTDEDSTVSENGTGFFIKENVILTSNHVIKKSKGQIKISKCHNQNIKLTAQVVAVCANCDYAILQLNEEYKSEFILELCNSEIIEEENIRIYGFPEGDQGQSSGENLSGSINMKVEDDSELIQDVILDIEGFANGTQYSGFSGSPVINDYGQVTSIVKYQAVRSLSSVSIKKALIFLEKNNIEVKPDQLQSFEVYNDKTFLGFEQMQSKCEVESQVPIRILSPGKILDSNKGGLFYPKNSQSINDLIKILRKSKDLDSKLWTGWIQLLTYVEILKGDYKDPNNISIHITSNELYKKFGLINTTRNVNVKIYLNFYFTEEESYLKIASKLIHEKKKGGLSKNVCNIFNSNVVDFGNTNNIKEDISNPTGSGPSIQNYKIGRLSLSQLNREVKSSNPIGQVSDNLKKIFEDVIK
jgi:predicted DNA-binding WGR domain protein